MPITFVVVDDEPLAVALIKQYASQYAVLQLAEAFTDAIAAQTYLRNNPTHLLFVDINMPDVSGIELVRSLNQKPMIVFTTAYRQYAVDSYDLDAIDYLLKPIEQERFDKAVQKVIEYDKYRNSLIKTDIDTIFVRSEYQLVKINLNDVEYIESAEDYSKIHLANGRPVMTLMTLKSMLEKLPAHRFKRIHRSYIIPVAKVVSANNKKIRLTTIELPVGDNYITIVQDLAKGM